HHAGKRSADHPDPGTSISGRIVAPYLGPAMAQEGAAADSEAKRKKKRAGSVSACVARENRLVRLGSRIQRRPAGRTGDRFHRCDVRRRGQADWDSRSRGGRCVDARCRGCVPHSWMAVAGASGMASLGCWPAFVSIRNVLGGRRRARTMARRRLGDRRTLSADDGRGLWLSDAASIWGNVGAFMRYIMAFLKFWYDFIVGDDWTIAAAVAVAITM